MTVKQKSNCRRVAVGAALLSLAGSAFAGDPASCKTVSLSDVGWTDITATTATTSVILEGLGYEPDVKVLAVPVTYKSMETGDIDVFLGNWMPTMEGDLGPYRDAGTVEVVQPANLTGAKYTLAVNKKAADAGRSVGGGAHERRIIGAAGGTRKGRRGRNGRVPARFQSSPRPAIMARRSQ